MTATLMAGLIILLFIAPHTAPLVITLIALLFVGFIISACTR